jgi:peptidoglycan hydrolase-like protein with peptidoglycan-binding domain
MPLKSDLFTTDLTVRSRLQQCQDNDSFQIRQGETGDHISAIQTALFLLLPNLRLPDAELGDPVTKRGRYGPLTAAAVEKYKRTHKPSILNVAGVIDRIVDKKTITYLDSELPSVGSGKTLPNLGPTPNPVAIESVRVDVVIRIEGYDSISQAGKEISSEDATEISKTAFQYPASGRLLWIIRFHGGEGAQNPTNKILEQVAQARAKGRPGKITVDGGSAGGRVALEVAKRLTEQKIKIDYVGIWDGAFQLADRVDATFDVTTGEPVLLKTPLIIASLKENWFQSFGNTLVAEQEIHGQLQGFHRNKSLDHLANISYLQALPTSINHVKQVAANSAHVAAYLYARDRASESVKSILRQP